ncbi:type III-B CRISPR module RAMP protein Cmr6 [Halothermothrix orenii]|uniref:CRISPR-associated RAMP protein, Cmr6 family n=1 Tax=Halothermothrix orenii (strain H 168 / OCM 544 / DSM 9562) TaxID=373903 RepID=B8CY92_HALOH|nr:type III-B CRISPR module RAMP protein Cmr6 [Halothermothrix orenii]ACL70261.1 CRISPR-associated RAMP protein, Cmr6 family [Halothermothrix orenii H 168]
MKERGRRKISRHNFKEGDIVEGRVTRIKPYGAFVRLDEKKKIDGLIYISNIADKYVKDITNYINEGDQIRVKIINIEKDGKIALSFKYKSYIPNDTNKIIKKTAIENFYLQTNYYIYDFDESDKKDILANLTKNQNQFFSTKEIKSFLSRQEKQISYLSSIGYSVDNFVMTNDYRMVVGLGGANVLETNLMLHHIYGIPYIPGSSLKGLTRAWAVEKLREELDVKSYEKIESLLGEEKIDVKTLDEYQMNQFEKYRWIFGTKSQSGNAVFFDAYPEGRINIDIDIMTPHFKEYYQEMETTKKVNNPPDDTQSPVPIPFLVLDNQMFRFSVAVKCKECAGKRDNSCEYLNLTVNLLKEALRNLGVGAKTMVGYGYFE